MSDRPERMLQRMLVAVDHSPTPMVGTLECGHTVKLDWTMTALSKWRHSHKIEMIRCEQCAAMPRPVGHKP